MSSSWTEEPISSGFSTSSAPPVGVRPWESELWPLLGVARPAPGDARSGVDLGSLEGDPAAGWLLSAFRHSFSEFRKFDVFLRCFA